MGDDGGRVFVLFVWFEGSSPGWHRSDRIGLAEPTGFGVDVDVDVVVPWAHAGARGLEACVDVGAMRAREGWDARTGLWVRVARVARSRSRSRSRGVVRLCRVCVGARVSVDVPKGYRARVVQSSTRRRRG